MRRYASHRRNRNGPKVEVCRPGSLGAVSAVPAIRHGSVADARLVLALFDEAVEWLIARGQTGQWGSEPFSAQEAQVARAAEWAAGGGLRIAEDAGHAPLGAMVVGARPAWVSPAPAPELYIELLVTSRRHAGQGVGGELIRRAIAEARAAELPLLRADCWRDAPALVEWYERQGFRRTGTFELNGWRGQVLSMELLGGP